MRKILLFIFIFYCSLVYAGFETDNLTIDTGGDLKVGTTTWSSSDEIDGTKIKDADYGDVNVSAGGAWTVQGATSPTFTTSIILSSPSVPSSSTDTGTAGQVAWDANYVYICIATNTWKKALLSDWGANYLLTTGGNDLLTTGGNYIAFP